MNDINQTLWPDHCVQATPGAEFHPALQRYGQTFLQSLPPDRTTTTTLTDVEAFFAGSD